MEQLRPYVAHRTRRHVEARRVRSDVTAQEQKRVVERFGVAVRTGELQPLLDVLAPDVVLVTDGGGRVKSATPSLSLIHI